MKRRQSAYQNEVGKLEELKRSKLEELNKLEKE
jgi:hypothetical protein